MGMAKLLQPEFDVSARMGFPSHPAISDATFCGCDNIATWDQATSTTAALRRLAMVRCKAGWIARSLDATRQRHVLPRHAGDEIVPPKAAPAVADWAD